MGQTKRGAIDGRLWATQQQERTLTPRAFSDGKPRRQRRTSVSLSRGRALPCTLRPVTIADLITRQPACEQGPTRAAPEHARSHLKQDARGVQRRRQAPTTSATSAAATKATARRQRVRTPLRSDRPRPTADRSQTQPRLRQRQSQHQRRRQQRHRPAAIAAAFQT